MPTTQDRAVALLHGLEEGWDTLRRRLRGAPRGPLRIEPYLGHGDATRLRLRLRVLAGAPLPPPRPGAGLAENLRRMARRFSTDEVAHARVRAAAGGRRLDLAADEEGFAEIDLDGLDPLPGRGLRRRPVSLALPDWPGVEAVGHALVVPREARLGVVSDVDDTILVTGAHSLWRNLYTSLTSDAEGRVAFPGVAAFYRALQAGRAGAPTNPVFYVSSSPWNLHDLLVRFMALHGIPEGPLFLRDLGLSAGGLTLKSGHARHKLAAIEALFAFHPNLPFVLIGDGGQHDAAIYAETVRRHPRRVLAVYVRDIATTPAARRETADLLVAVEGRGVPAVLCPDLTRAAEHAAKAGWIEPEAVAAVRGEAVREGRPS
ncbi:MAG: DUF2183 domain-containing protein [Geminicoccaceae bacterium]|nr:DUF2183 domain-containing protein [Geminicoccaceae bacterium]